MSTLPTLLHHSTCRPSRIRPSKSLPTRSGWIWVLLAVAFVACTSTSLTSGAHSQIVVNDLWRAAFGKWHSADAGPLNLVLRKIGHFLGYGTIGLIFRNAWHSSLRSHLVAVSHRWLGGRLLFASSALSILSIFLLAGLDEWHQTFVPQRVGCFRDVMIDTTGALFLNVVFYTWRACGRKRALRSV